MSATASIREAKAGLSRLVERARRGSPTVITSHGRPVARLVEADDGTAATPVDAVFAALRHEGLAEGPETPFVPRPVRPAKPRKGASPVAAVLAMRR